MSLNLVQNTGNGNMTSKEYRDCHGRIDLEAKLIIAVCLFFEGMHGSGAMCDVRVSFWIQLITIRPRPQLKKISQFKNHVPGRHIEFMDGGCAKEILILENGLTD